MGQCRDTIWVVQCINRISYGEGLTQWAWPRTTHPGAFSCLPRPRVVCSGIWTEESRIEQLAQREILFKW